MRRSIPHAIAGSCLGNVRKADASASQLTPASPDVAQTRAPHLFLFTGLRLAMKAAMPSDRSSSAKVE